LLYYRIISVLCLALSFWANRWLPVQWGWENNVLECLQALILALGLILSWIKPHSSSYTKNIVRYFGLFSTPIWLLLIGRELSWGRVFFPLGVNASGPYFPPLSALWYGSAVYPAITIILFFWVFALLKYRLYMIPLNMIRCGVFPWTNFSITFIGTVIAYIAERRLHLPITEEVAESVVYIGLIVLALQVKHILLKYNAFDVNKHNSSSLF